MKPALGQDCGLCLYWVLQLTRLHFKVPAVSAVLSGHLEAQSPTEQRSRVQGTHWPPVQGDPQSGSRKGWGQGYAHTQDNEPHDGLGDR